LGIFLSTSVWAFNFNQFGIDLGELSKEIMGRHTEFEQKWQDNHNWKGTFCENGYGYKVYFYTILKNIDLKIAAENTLDATVDLNNLYARFDGTFKSDFTACFTLKGWSGIGFDSARINAQVKVVEKENGDLEYQLKVLSTQTQGMHIGKYVPKWFSNFLNNRLNAGLNLLWKTKIGAWVSQKISDQVNKKLGGG
jgi:hypothetical protein